MRNSPADTKNRAGGAQGAQAGTPRSPWKTHSGAGLPEAHTGAVDEGLQPVGRTRAGAGKTVRSKE